MPALANASREAHLKLNQAHQSTGNDASAKNELAAKASKDINSTFGLSLSGKDQATGAAATGTTGAEHSLSSSDESKALRHIIGALVHQYLLLFDKAKIYEIKRVKGLQKQIMNYVSGHMKKLQQSTQADSQRKAEVFL